MNYEHMQAALSGLAQRHPEEEPIIAEAQRMLYRLACTGGKLLCGLVEETVEAREALEQLVSYDEHTPSRKKPIPNCYACGLPLTDDNQGRTNIGMAHRSCGEAAEVFHALDTTRRQLGVLQKAVQKATYGRANTKESNGGGTKAVAHSRSDRGSGYPST